MILAQCPVCHESFTTFSDCIVSALPCGHVFHNHCVNQWFSTSSTCPQCRVSVRPSRVVARLFFDVVTLSPVRPTSSSVKNANSSQDLTVDLYRIREENSQLKDALRESKSKSEQRDKTVTELQQGVQVLTTYSQEWECRWSAERKRCTDLKIEIAGLRKFLSDAQNMQAEAVRLRSEMDDMQSIKKLISASADDAHDILRRYSVQREASCTATIAGGRIESAGERSQSSADTLYNLESLSRWTAALRGELTASREKARSYRIEASRLRKMHAMALQRSAKAEESLKKSERELKDANDMIRSLMGLSRFQQEGGDDRGVVNLKEATAPDGKASEWVESPADESLMGSRVSMDLFSPITGGRRSRKSAPLSTPDQLCRSPGQAPSSSQLKRQLRTPSGNPFAVPQYPSMQPPSTSDQHVKKSKPPVEPIAQSSVITIANRSGNPPNRHSSSIFQMSILRRHLRQSFQAVSTSTSSVSVLTNTNQDRRIADSSHTIYPCAGSKNIAVSKMKRNRRDDKNKSNKPGTKSSRLDAFFGALH